MWRGDSWPQQRVRHGGHSPARRSPHHALWSHPGPPPLFRSPARRLRLRPPALENSVITAPIAALKVWAPPPHLPRIRALRLDLGFRWNVIDSKWQRSSSIQLSSRGGNEGVHAAGAELAPGTHALVSPGSSPLLSPSSWVGRRHEAGRKGALPAPLPGKRWN